MKTLITYLLIFAGVVVIYFFAASTRYSMQSGEHGIAYKLDRWTGRMWEIADTIEREIIRQPKISPSSMTAEERIIQAVQMSRSGSQTVQASIDADLMQKKGCLKIYGWRVKRLDDQNYLVSYSYDENGKSMGPTFVFNEKANLVRPGNVVLLARHTALKYWIGLTGDSGFMPVEISTLLDSLNPQSAPEEFFTAIEQEAKKYKEWEEKYKSQKPIYVVRWDELTHKAPMPKEVADGINRIAPQSQEEAMKYVEKMALRFNTLWADPIFPNQP